MRLIGGAVLGLVALLGVRYAIREAFTSVITSVSTDQAAACLSLSGSTTAVENGNTDIIGTIKNDCNRKFSQVAVSFKVSRSSSAAAIPTALYLGATADRSPQRPAIELPDAVILAYARDVQPGESRKFRSSSHIDKNAIFRFDKISGF